RRRPTRSKRDWRSAVCSSDLTDTYLGEGERGTFGGECDVRGGHQTDTSGPGDTVEGGHHGFGATHDLFEDVGKFGGGFDRLPAQCSPDLLQVHAGAEDRPGPGEYDRAHLVIGLRLGQGRGEPCAHACGECVAVRGGVEGDGG